MLTDWDALTSRRRRSDDAERQQGGGAEAVTTVLSCTTADPVVADRGPGGAAYNFRLVDLGKRLVDSAPGAGAD